MVIVLLHCSTFRVVLNVALSSPKGLSFPLSQTTDIYVEKRREPQTYREREREREAKGGEWPQASESSSHSSRALLPVLLGRARFFGRAACALVLHLPSVLPHHKQNAPLSAPSWPAHLWPRRKCPAICDRIEACMKNRGAPPLQSGGLNQKWPTKWANWLPHPCRIGEPHRCRAGGKIRSGPQSGQIGYLTPAASGSPTAAERGTKSEVAHKVGKLATSPLPYRGAPPLQSGGQNQKWPTKWANWLPHPCRIGEPHRCRAGDKIRSGPQSGQIGYLTPAVSGSPTAAERGTKSEVAHKVGKLATSPLPYRGAPPLQSGGQNQKWPTRWLHNLFCAFQPFLNSPQNSEYFEYRHIGWNKKNSPCRMPKTKSPAPPAPTRHLVPCDNFGVRRAPPPFGVGS